MMSFLTSLAGTLSKALSGLRHPTRGIKRAIGRVGIRAATKVISSVSGMREWMADTVIADVAEDFPSDILEIISAASKEKLMSKLDPLKKVPRKLMVEARIKESRKYLVTWKVTKQFHGEEGTIETYVSGYFDESMSPEEWYEEYADRLAQSRYAIDYSTLTHELAMVQHRIGERY